MDRRRAKRGLNTTEENNNDSAIAAIIIHGPRCEEEEDAANNICTPCVSCGTRNEWNRRVEALEAAGASLIQVPRLYERTRTSTGTMMITKVINHHINIKAALTALSAPPFSVKSIMVEGGASLIASFISQQQQRDDDDPEKLIDAVFVTLAPFFLPGGVHTGDNDKNSKVEEKFPLFFDIFEKIGKDIVVLALPIEKNTT